MSLKFLLMCLAHQDVESSSVLLVCSFINSLNNGLLPDSTLGLGIEDGRHSFYLKNVRRLTEWPCEWKQVTAAYLGLSTL